MLHVLISITVLKMRKKLIKHLKTIKKEQKYLFFFDGIEYYFFIFKLSILANVASTVYSINLLIKSSSNI